MGRRERLRKTPGAVPRENWDGCCSQKYCCHRIAPCAGRPARPLPASFILAMAAAAGKGVYAFAPIALSDWPALGRGRSDVGESRRWDPCWKAGEGAQGSAVAASEAIRFGRRRRSRQERDRAGGGRGQTWLAGTTSPNSSRKPMEKTPASAAAYTTQDQPEARGQKRAGAQGGNSRAQRTSSLNDRGRRDARGAALGDGGGEVFSSTDNPSSGEKLAELLNYDLGIEEQPEPLATNKTELSQKVEAELFEEYDAMVPGPSAPLTALDGSVGKGVAPERTGRPLAINLDLLSYHARQRVLKGDYVSAQKLYRDCVELDPRDGRGWLGLARQMQKIHKFDKAQRLFEAGLENCVDNPYLLQAFAVMEEQRGNQAKALSLLNRSVRVHPEHTASWVALGLLNERNKRVDEARGCFRTATDNDPRNHYAWLVWAMLEKRVGNTADAREKFKICVKANRRNSKAYQAWGVLEAEGGNYELAAELFKAGLEQQPSNTYIMQAWALMEASRGEISRATRLLKRALIKRPHDGAVWQTYALLMKGKGDVEGARALFRKGVEQTPKHCPTWQAWGMMEWQLGNVATARKLFQEGVWEAPRGAFVVRILQAWAILEATEGNFGDARKYFGFALARDPYSLPVMVAWALMEETLGDIGRARQLLDIATSTEPQNVNVWNVYEQMETRAGFHEEARAIYERGLMAGLAKNRDASRAAGWWDTGGPLLEPSSARGASLLDQASRSLGTSSAEMALRVSRIIGGVQWASDYMTFSALNSSRTGEVALEP